MKSDSRGLAVTTDSDAAIHAIDHFAEQLLSLGAESNAILEDALTYPDCAMVQAYAACTYVYAQSPVQAANARPLLERARQRIADLSERERLFIEAVEAGCRGDFEAALSCYEKIAQRWPRDVVAAKLAEFHFFQTGESQRQLEFMRAIAPANRDHSHLQSMYAFALELCGQREQAESVARSALRLNPLTMWAQHCLAHVFAGQSRIAQGISEMQGYSQSWRGFGRYIQAHNWFHLATLYLANLEFEKALDAFRWEIWGFVPDSAGELTDAILLLWYVELAGGNCDAQWRAIAPHARPYANEQLFPFLNAITLYALSRAGEEREVQTALDAMRRFADAQSATRAQVWREIGMPLARGCVAYARGRYGEAAALLGPILSEVQYAGGSDEQRGVFIQSNLMALLRSGQKRDAARALHEYIGARGVTPLEERWLQQL
jgi:tetratricopeptide (TPR) repeat protein